MSPTIAEQLKLLMVASRNLERFRMAAIYSKETGKRKSYFAISSQYREEATKLRDRLLLSLGEPVPKEVNWQIRQIFKRKQFYSRCSSCGARGGVRGKLLDFLVDNEWLSSTLLTATQDELKQKLSVSQCFCPRCKERKQQNDT